MILLGGWHTEGSSAGRAGKGPASPTATPCDSGVGEVDLLSSAAAVLRRMLCRNLVKLPGSSHIPMQNVTLLAGVHGWYSPLGGGGDLAHRAWRSIWPKEGMALWGSYSDMAVAHDLCRQKGGRLTHLRPYSLVSWPPDVLSESWSTASAPLLSSGLAR